MKFLFCYAFLLCFLLAPAFAGAAGQGSGVTQKPVCFTIRNFAPFTVFGTVVTDAYTEPSGHKAKHRSNIRLEKGRYAEFCSTGPFFEGRKLDIQLKTLFPIFECRTALTAPLAIRAIKKPEGGYKTWIDCID